MVVCFYGQPMQAQEILPGISVKNIGGKIIVIDEIHKYQNWANEIKTIYDSFPELIIRFSGSSMLNILNEKFDLSRRCVIS